MATVRAKADRDSLLKDFFAPMTPETARAVLQVRFSRRTLKLLGAMLERNRRGTLTPEERAEMECFLDFGDFLTILHSKARLRLKKLAGSQHKGKPV